ncbi:MAG TPA: hypothetical protein DEA78_22000, partial [Cyanobacteria bacterium UBA11159]|nr:hypothetical protein [Cyanobacteria bacterium UBA11366]HBK64747.1 hypothetical protein [Cyanobacteria bacterium UBA11166]HBR76285.1 hypothetical protein [Cyanobacteria bacterium UBA11159]
FPITAVVPRSDAEFRKVSRWELEISTRWQYSFWDLILGLIKNISSPSQLTVPILVFQQLSARNCFRPNQPD